jgi:hypothetical protein
VAKGETEWGDLSAQRRKQPDEDEHRQTFTFLLPPSRFSGSTSGHFYGSNRVLPEDLERLDRSLDTFILGPFTSAMDSASLVLDYYDSP